MKTVSGVAKLGNEGAVEKQRCSKNISGTFTGHPCGNTAKVVRDGKAYCNTHDLVKVQQRDDARWAKWDAKAKVQREVRDRADKARRTQELRASLGLELARYVIERTMSEEAVAIAQRILGTEE